MNLIDSKKRDKWRESHPAEWDLINRRTTRTKVLILQWVRQNRPDIYAACQREAKRQVPIADLAVYRQHRDYHNEHTRQWRRRQRQQQ